MPSGARLDPEALTAAHRSLPFGTRLRVTHGDRSVVVTINDKGAIYLQETTIGDDALVPRLQAMRARSYPS